MNPLPPIEANGQCGPSTVEAITVSVQAWAGVPEYWLVGARGVEAVLAIHQWTAVGYAQIPGDDTGFVNSPLLGGAFRLARRERLQGIAVYRLEERPER